MDPERDPDPDTTFQLISDPAPAPDLVSDPTWFFSNILDRNFTFVLLPCKVAHYDEI